MQGVAVSVFVKTGKKKKDQLGGVLHYDLFGKRGYKYEQLSQNSLKSIEFRKVNPEAPNFFFVPKDYELSSQYKNGFLLSELFRIQSMGITSARDSFVIDLEETTLKERIISFSNLEYDDHFIRERFFGDKKEGKYLKGDTRGWKLSDARRAIAKNEHQNFIQPISYRPFDTRVIYYSDKMVDWGRQDVMRHLLRDNIALNLVKVGRDANAHNYFITTAVQNVFTTT